MIKIDYLIERQEGDKIEKYKPTLIPTELPNVVYVQGPNSAGKSTLLNMIALAFFGQRLSNDELNDDLRSRLDNLINSDHQKIKFRIEVENDVLGTKLVSQKDSLESTDIIVRNFATGKGSPITAESFKREYKLIYDIPNNPLERLPLLLNSLRIEQKDMGMEVKRLKDYLRRMIDEIKESKDPELIEKLRDKLKSDQADHGMKNKILSEELRKHKKLSQYYWARFYRYYQEEQDEIKSNIEKITRQLGKRKRQQSHEYRDKLFRYGQLEDRITQVESLVQSIKTILPKLLPKNQIKRYTFWANADVRNEVFHPDIYDGLRKESRFLSEYLRDEVFTEKQKHQNEIANVKLLKTLIRTLDEYKNENITVPVVNLSIEDFINSLNADLEKYKKIVTKLENIDDCASSLERLAKLVDETIPLAANLPGKEKHLDAADSEEILRQQELEGLETRIVGVAEKAGEYRAAIIKDGLDPEELSKKYLKLKNDPEIDYYEHYTESQLNEKLKTSELRYITLQDDCRKLERRIADANEEIKRLEEKKPHRYQDNYLAIQRLLKWVQKLEVNFDSFDKVLKKMTDNAIKYSDLSDEDRLYSNAVGEYLAKKIGTIRHISMVHKVNKIDVVSKKILTNSGKVIHFSDLGTGQSQAAYLDTLLSMSENKKIIALFDEIAMMDETSLKPIKDKLRKLYDEKKLLMAVIVQKGEHVKVESIT